MGKLQHIQDQLLTDIFSITTSNQFDPKGLYIYRTNLRATATRALGITFPTIRQLLGEEALAVVAEKLLQTHPPHQGDWAVWGDALPNLLSTLTGLEDYPFLEDCAQLDYHCHQIIRHPFSKTKVESLLLMQFKQPEVLFLDLNPTLLLMQSEFPVAEIRRVHQDTNSSLEALEAAVHDVTGQHYIACYLNHTAVKVESVSATEYAWLKSLKNKSLSTALDDFEGKDFYFDKWLMRAVQNNLLHEVIHQPNNEE